MTLKSKEQKLEEKYELTKEDAFKEVIFLKGFIYGLKYAKECPSYKGLAPILHEAKDRIELLKIYLEGGDYNRVKDKYYVDKPAKDKAA